MLERTLVHVQWGNWFRVAMVALAVTVGLSWGSDLARADTAPTPTIAGSVKILLPPLVVFTTPTTAAPVGPLCFNNQTQRPMTCPPSLAGCQRVVLGAGVVFFCQPPTQPREDLCFEARTGERAAICTRELAGDYRFSATDA